MNICLVFSLILVVANCASIDLANKTSLAPSRLWLKYASRISDGNPASTKQFPFYAYILAQGSNEASSCGGSIFSPNWVVTAAHCTFGYLTLDLYFGSTDIYEMPVILTSTHWIIHQNYNPATYTNDISVVELPSPLAYTPSIQPVTLLATSESGNDFLAETATVMGFGYTSDSDPTESPDLLFTNVEIISNTVCTGYYGSSIVTSGTMCAKGASTPTQSICSGDSGGPLVITNNNGGYTQIGINSFVSNAGCQAGMPSGYVRLGSYLGWISAQTLVPIP